MPSTKLLVRRFVVATASVAVMAIPLQAGTAHASTPTEDLSTCIDTAMANVSGDDFTTAVNACVDTYLQEIGIDPATMTFDTPPSTDPTVDTTSDGGDSVDTGILGSSDSSDAVAADPSSDASANTADG